jgi:hypothetical protein
MAGNIVFTSMPLDSSPSSLSLLDIPTAAVDCCERIAIAAHWHASILYSVILAMRKASQGLSMLFRMTLHAYTY